jgi:hypothetical protein
LASGGGAAPPGGWVQTVRVGLMHSLLVSASPVRDRSTVAAWIAGAVGRGERVLYKHAPTEDAAAMHTITRTDAELTGYERDLERLAIEAGVRSLCRYPPEERPELLHEMLVVHYRDVDDDVWGAELVAVACGCTGRSTSPPLTGSPRCCGPR